MAEDRLTDDEIAKRAGIKRTQLHYWKRHPDFQARVAEHVTALAEQIKARGLAERSNRIDYLNDRRQRMQALLEARGADMAGEVAGGETGLMVRSPKLVKVYESPDLEDDRAPIAYAKRERIVYEYAFDRALVQEMREHEKQAAQELGQWTEKREVSGEIGVRTLIGVSLDDL